MSIAQLSHRHILHIQLIGVPIVTSLHLQQPQYLHVMILNLHWSIILLNASNEYAEKVTRNITCSSKHTAELARFLRRLPLVEVRYAQLTRLVNVLPHLLLYVASDPQLTILTLLLPHRSLPQTTADIRVAVCCTTILHLIRLKWCHCHCMISLFAAFLISYLYVKTLYS